MFNGEILIHLEENLEQLEHTRKCITEALYNGLPCKCCLDKLKDQFMEYRRKLWEENRSF